MPAKNVTGQTMEAYKEWLKKKYGVSSYAMCVFR
jgi:hypothetical protein